MAGITGASTRIILKLGSTYGTAVAGGANDKMEVESLSHDEGAQELRVNPIGSGNDMDVESERGSTSPTVNFDKVCAYDDVGVTGMALFFGSATSTIQGASAQCHSLTYNATRFNKYATIAFNASSAAVFEYPSCSPSSLSVTAENAKDYVRMSMGFLADSQQLASSTNTTATLATATIANSKRVIVKPSDEFLINAQAGSALATPTDRVNITSFKVDYTYDLEHVREIKGSAGNGVPISTGSPPFTCKLTIQLRNLSDLTYFTAAQAGTEYKAKLTITGDTISGSIAYQMALYFPRLKIVDDPQYDLTTTGENPLTVTFKALVASTAPSGMSISTYPFVTVINTKTANYLA